MLNERILLFNNVNEYNNVFIFRETRRKGKISEDVD